MYQNTATWLATPDTSNDRAVAFSTYDYVACGAVEAASLLRRAQEVIDRRAAFLTRSRQGKWDGPELLVIVEETSALLGDPVNGARIRALLDEIAWSGRTLGVDLESRPGQ